MVKDTGVSHSCINLSTNLHSWDSEMEDAKQNEVGERNTGSEDGKAKPD